MWNRTENQVTLAIIRHGETQANKERRYLGKTDETLSESGIEILRCYKEQNCYPDVEYLFASPMKRCMETAKILYPKLRPVIIPEWEEMDFGQFEYKNYEELKDDSRYQKWIDSGGSLDFPDGESRAHFIMRCEAGLMKMCDKLYQMTGADTNEPIRAGIIAHGGTVMALLHSFSGADYFDSQISNGRGYLCKMKWYGEGIPKKDNIQIKVIAKI